MKTQSNPNNPSNGRSIERVALVAMPWSDMARPSAAIAALASHVRRERPDLVVDCRYAYLDFAEQYGLGDYPRISDMAYSVGEPLYLGLLYPHRRDAIIADLAERKEARACFAGEDAAARGRACADLIEQLEIHLERTAASLASFDVVGLTTCFGQLFANLALARRLEQINPNITVVLGGSTVSSQVGPSLLDEYPHVDFVVQGEGERPFVALLEALESGTAWTTAMDGVVSRAGGWLRPAPLLEVSDMDALPIPDYDAYSKRADELWIGWSLPVEASRGCWWDRTKRAANPKATCYFCNLNTQWGGYREKSPNRVAAEVEALTDSYKNLRLYFVDNIVRLRGADDLAASLGALGRDFEIFYEMRANISPRDILALWETGLRSVQFGIEALSSSMLARIGKGTSVIQNLQAMRICAELGISNMANLIIDFPGSTDEEVQETVRAIEELAFAYQPLATSPFRLGRDSAVARLPEEFGVRGIRNSSVCRAGLGDELWERLELFDLEYEDCSVGPAADWSPVLEACARWRKRHAEAGGQLLYYRDAGSYVWIIDDRDSEYAAEGIYEGRARDLYLYCTQIRTRRELERRFGNFSELAPVLEEWVDARIMVQEGNRYLSLAIAARPREAARRIYAEAAAQPRRRALPVLAEIG